MGNHCGHGTCPGAAYLQRAAERLVIQGYRHCLSACIGQNNGGWSDAFRLHVSDLGPNDGHFAMDALVDLIGVLGQNAIEPLRFFPPNSPHLCRQEALLLSLLACLQQGEDRAAREAANALACPLTGEDVLVSGADYAFRLRASGRTLLPVPNFVVAGIAGSHGVQAGNPAAELRSPGSTLH